MERLVNPSNLHFLFDVECDLVEVPKTRAGSPFTRCHEDSRLYIFHLSRHEHGNHERAISLCSVLNSPIFVCLFCFVLFFWLNELRTEVTKNIYIKEKEIKGVVQLQQKPW